MIFNSVAFFVFLVIAFSSYWASPQKFRPSLLVLLSYVFYGWWNWRFLSLIIISTLADYTIARVMATSETKQLKKRLLGLSLTINLGILAFFKYFNFFIDSAESSLASLGFDVSGPALQIALPVGISFYTFQTLSYTFDVYRERIQPEKNLMTFAAFVSYFPQLVAGPIERAQALLPQLQRKAVFPTAAVAKSAAALIVTGLFKKIVIGDAVATIVETRFADPSAHGTISLWFGVYAFALQIYGDFAGYSSIARGVSRLFGIELIRNFEQPYLSKSITQFWRTWHISLSNWLHDYLYVSLGGNRKGTSRTYINLMATMVLGGLWHGASWNFVLWGTIHGVLLAGHRLLGAYENRGMPSAPRLRDLPAILLTFHLVAAAWVPFRAQSFGQTMDYFGGLVTWSSGLPAARVALFVAVLLATMITLDLIDRNRTKLKPLQWHPVVHGIATGIAISSVLAFSGGEPVEFIYFQF